MRKKEDDVAYPISPRDMIFVLDLVRQINDEVKQEKPQARSVRWWALVMILFGLIRKGYPAGTHAIKDHFKEAIDKSVHPHFQSLVEQALIHHVASFNSAPSKQEKHIVQFPERNDIWRN